MNSIARRALSGIPVLAIGAALILIGPGVAFAQRGGGGHGGRSGGGSFGRSYSGGGRSYSGPSYSRPGLCGAVRRSYSAPYSGNYGARSYYGNRGYAAPYANRGYYNGRGLYGGYYPGRFYAGRGYYYGGHFWARPVFRSRDRYSVRLGL